MGEGKGLERYASMQNGPLHDRAGRTEGSVPYLHLTQRLPPASHTCVSHLPCHTSRPSPPTCAPQHFQRAVA